MHEHGYQMLLHAPNQRFNEYSLTDVSWEVNNDNDLLIGEDGYVKGIKVLEKLKESIPKNNNHATSLTGKIKINVRCNIDEAYIYNTYYKTYPKLTFEYDKSKVNLVEALRVNFLASNTDDSDYLYKLLLPTDNNKTLKFLTSADGPSGEEIGIPSRAQDGRYTYHWNSTLDDADWTIVEKNEDKTHEEVMDIVPTTSMTFKPKFTSIERKYHLTLLDYN
jgi:hypothetical protein